MTEPTRPPGAFSTAERATRRSTLIVGAGFVSFVLGSMMTVGAVPRLAGVVGELDSDLLIAVLTALLQSLWVLVFLPVTGWLGGRFLEVKPWRFAVPAAITGLVFNVLLSWAVFGGDSMFVDWLDAVLRVTFFGAGVALTMWAVKGGARAFDLVLAKSKAAAQANQAEYAKFANNEKPPL